MSKILLLFFVAFYSLVSRASCISDTSVKRDIPKIKSFQNQFTDYSNVKDAIAYIKQDSINKGIKLLSNVARHAASEKKITRTLPYLWFELFDLLTNTDPDNLSESEKQLWYSFFKISFNRENAPTEKDMALYIKKAPNTLFSRRVKLLLMSSDNRKKVNRELDKLLIEAPNLVSLNILKADMFYDEEKYDESIKYSTKAVELFPQYAYAYNRRAKCYAGLNQPDKAIGDYNDAIKLSPAYYEVYYNRANSFMDMDKYREAIEDYQKTRFYNPDYEWCTYNLARCYKSLEMPDSALYYINLHINGNPEDGDGYNIKGDIYYSRDEYVKAIDLYTQAIKLDQGKSFFYEDRADAYYYNKQVDEALTDFKKAIDIDNRRYYAFKRIGDCYYEKKEFSKSVTFYQKAIKLDSSYKYAYTGLDLSYIKLGDYQKAIDVCKKAVEIDSTFSLGLGNMGWTYYCSGDFNACIEYSYKALKYEPGAVYAMFNIALATLRKGDFEKAKELYSYFLKKCKENKYEVNDGAVDDLRDLISNKIYVEQSSYIIERVFEKKP